MISSTFSTRAWFGPQSQMASMAGSATISVIEPYAFARPTSSFRAKAAASCGVLLVGAPDAEDVGVADALPGLHVKAGVESAADESDAETTLGHVYSTQV